MRIGVDARELCGQSTGVGRYLGGLLEEWRTTPAHDFVFYVPAQAEAVPQADHFETRVLPGGGGSWWEQVTLRTAADEDHLDVFFAPAYTAPLRLRTPVVAAIHDVSFAARPEWFTTREGVRRRWLARQTAARATRLITISEFSRRELVAHLGADDRLIHVIPPGITRPPGHETGSMPAPSVLYVGSIFNRRRVPDLIKAFARVAGDHADVTLNLVGDNRSFPREDLTAIIGQEPAADRIRWRQYVSDATLGALYGGARAFAFLSEYEGLGLTPLEALSAGVPPVLLDTPVARESCGDAARYVALGDIHGTAQALEALLFDEGSRDALLRAAPGVLSKYSWPAAARETLSVLSAAALNGRPS